MKTSVNSSSGHLIARTVFDQQFKRTRLTHARDADRQPSTHPLADEIGVDGSGSWFQPQQVAKEQPIRHPERAEGSFGT